MIVTTTQGVDGKKVKAYLGVVAGASPYNAASLPGGGYAPAGQPNLFNYAVNSAITAMIGNAYGAEAIIGVQIAVSSSGVMNQEIVTVTGTAVTLEDAGFDTELPDI